MASWNVLDHPADLAVEGHGCTREEALTGVVEGLLAQLSPGDPPPGRLEEISVEGLDQAECLVSVLNELLYRVGVGQRWLSCPEVVELRETRVTLRVRSRRRPAGLALDTEVKAATYHDLSLTREPDGGWALRVVFDL